MKTYGSLFISLFSLSVSASSFADFPSLRSLGLEESFSSLQEYSIIPKQSIEADSENFPKTSDKPRAREPLVKKTDLGFQIDENFLSNAKMYGEMEQMSYELVKGCLASSSALTGKYRSIGWEISGFGGVSGADGSENTDLPGVVAFNPMTGEAVVAFHGSQDSHDWHDNLDGQMLFAKELKDQTGRSFSFDGRVSKGYAKRYLSSRETLYAFLNRFFERSPEDFHITVVGHSLGGAMGELAVADLATCFAKNVWGKDYRNAESNRVRAYLMSAALVFDDEASGQAEKFVGRHNVIQDAVASDPVYYVSGKSTSDYLNRSYRYGPTALGLKLLQWFGFTKVAHPMLASFLYGKGTHIGYEAPQTVFEVQKLALSFVDVAVQKVLSEKWFWSRWWASFVGEKLAPLHYGSNQIKQDGSGKLTRAFDPRYIVPETFAERIERTESQKTIEAAVPVVEQEKAWYQGWWPF